MSHSDDENKQAELAKAVRQLRDSMPAQLEIAQLQAVLTRQRFVELVAAGFTEEQALILCKQ